MSTSDVHTAYTSAGAHKQFPLVRCLVLDAEYECATGP